MKSIQTKFIILILGCLFLSSSVIGGAGILNSKRVVDQDSAKIMNLMCSERTQEINALLSRIQQSVKTLAVYAIAQLESVERLTNDPDYLHRYTAKLEEVAVNAASNTEGAMAVYVRFNPDFTPPTSGLFWSKTVLDGSFRQLVPTDFSGFSPTDTEHVGWYYIPIKNGKATWMRPYLNKNINVEMISFVIPLYLNNQTVGVVGMDIDFSVITDIVKAMRVYQNGYAFLTDKTGNIMFHPEFPFGTELASADGALRPIAWEIGSGTSGSTLFPYTWRGEEKKMAFRPLSNGMRLAITSPILEIDAAKNDLTLQIAVALAVIAAFSVALTIFMTRRLTRPLRELTEAAKKIAAGDLSVNLLQRMGDKDEVGKLAESFQQTVEHLQKYISYINGLAYRDSLTGVKNKTAYLEAESRFEEQMRLGRPEFAVVVLDINGLKRINDTYGHDFGDMLIINACRLICKVFQHSPVFRIGGDEFTVILEKTDYEHYPDLLQRLEEEISNYNAKARSDTQVSIARGIAVYNSETDLVFANVFKRADDAMYENKAAMKARMAEAAGKSRTDDESETGQEAASPDKPQPAAPEGPAAS
ncbi:MAG: diguanylate cyclase [Bilophila sp.]